MSIEDAGDTAAGQHPGAREPSADDHSAREHRTRSERTRERLAREHRPDGAPADIDIVARVAAAAFVLDGLVLVALIVVGAPKDASFFAQCLLMPLLLVWALARLPNGDRLPARIATPVALAIACSAVGDTLPGFLVAGDTEVRPGTSLSEGPTPFIARIIAFALAQIAWITVTMPWRRRSILRPGVRPLVLAYAAAAVAVLVLAAPGAGWLVFAILPYAVIVTTAAVLATGLGPAGALSSLLFLVSGAMFGIFKFAPLLDPGEPVHSVSIMVGYMSAQAMLVFAVRREIAREGWPPADR